MKLVQIKAAKDYGKKNETTGKYNSIVTLYLSNDNNGGFLANTFASTLYAVGADITALMPTLEKDDHDNVDWEKSLIKANELFHGKTDDSLRGYDLPISELSKDLFDGRDYPEQFDAVTIKDTTNEMGIMHIASADRETAELLAKNNLRRQILNGRFVIVTKKEESK